VHADQAEAILHAGKADLVALARELLYNPDWAMDAAQKLQADPGFSALPPNYAYWLGKRANSAFEGVPSTFQSSIMAGVEQWARRRHRPVRRLPRRRHHALRRRSREWRNWSALSTLSRGQAGLADHPCGTVPVREGFARQAPDGGSI
jgi:hypothetical protein